MRNRMRMRQAICAALAAVVALAGSGAAGSAARAPARTAGAPSLGAILDGYNAGVERALAAIESLRVTQETYEPRPDGEPRRATATLVYGRGCPVERRDVTSNLVYPAGDCTLASLVGPTIDTVGYAVTLSGVETMEGEPSYRLDLLAKTRDVDHFDGTIWISTSGLGPVRIAGVVADPPFPLREIKLDKSFTEVEGGIRLLRRHTGEAQAGAILGRKRGTRHIFYEDYRLLLAAHDPEDEETRK